MKLLPLLFCFACADKSDTDADTGTDSGLETTVDTAETVDTSETSVETVVMETTSGTIVIELDFYAAPVTANNFMEYVDSGFYDGTDGYGATIFHRVINDFMIQGGGYTAAGVIKETLSPIINEAATSGLSNVRGTIAMARTNAPNSATSQFFINHVDNLFLDATNTDAGYAVFGVVTDGMDVVDTISSTQTDNTDKPLVDIAILSVQVGD
jgi:peptidyl-prolyl cis-trans isomerase A (cyclophilin A)